MATGRDWKRLTKSSKFKFVAKFVGVKDFVKWQGSVLGKSRFFDEEKEAARWVDLRLIDKGEEPVNLFKRK